MNLIIILLLANTITTSVFALSSKDKFIWINSKVYGCLIKVPNATLLKKSYGGCSKYEDGHVVGFMPEVKMTKFVYREGWFNLNFLKKKCQGINSWSLFSNPGPGPKYGSPPTLGCEPWYRSIISQKKCLEVDLETEGQIYEINVDESYCNVNPVSSVDTGRANTIVKEKNAPDRPEEEEAKQAISR